MDAGADVAVDGNAQSLAVMARCGRVGPVKDERAVLTAANSAACLVQIVWATWNMREDAGGGAHCLRLWETGLAVCFLSDPRWRGPMRTHSECRLDDESLHEGYCRSR